MKWLYSSLAMTFIILSVWPGRVLATTPLGISSLASLAFGKFASGTGGTVTINPAGSRSRSGDVALLSGSSGSAGRFQISGDSDAAYIITLPSNGEVYLTSGASSVAVVNFTSSPSSAGVLNGLGTQIVTIGATLVLDSSKATGSYSGTYAISVDYQ
jgi:hypothetical protein